MTFINYHEIYSLRNKNNVRFKNNYDHMVRTYVIYTSVDKQIDAPPSIIKFDPVMNSFDIK